MVAKPDVHGLYEARLERDPFSLPICLEFGPVLEALAEAGYVGERLNEWLVDFNQANKDTMGKLELDAEGRLLLSPMQSQEGSLSEGIVFGNCTHGSKNTAVRPTARGWASNCPTARATLPTRPGFPQSNSQTIPLQGRLFRCVTAPTS